MRRSALTLLLLFAASCAVPCTAAAAPWSFIVEPTEQMAVPGYAAGTEITPEGYLYTGSAEVVFRYGRRMRPWNVPIRTLADGRYPVFSSRASAGGVTYTLTTFAAAVGGQAVNFVRVRMTNRRRATASAGWAIGTRYTGGEPKAGGGRRFRFARPATPPRSGLYYQPGYGFNPGSVHRFTGRAFERDGRALYITHRKPAGIRSRAARGPRRATPTTLVGLTRYHGRLRPGRSVVLDFTVPTVPVDPNSAAYRQIAAAPYAKTRARVLGAWRRRLSGAMGVHVPEDKVVDTFYASLMNLLMARYQQDGYWIQTVNKLQYHAFWLRDAAMITSMFDQVGMHDVAAQDLRFFLTWQQPDGLVISRTGQYDGIGQALWAFGDHVRRTGDVKFAQSVLPAVGRAMDWLEKARAADPLGLLPPSDPHDNEQIAGHLTGDNLWGVAGAHAAATIARSAGDPQTADRWAAEAAAYQATLDAQIRQAAKGTGGWIPAAVDAKGGEDWGNLWPVYPTGLYSATDDMVERTMRHARARFEEGIATYLDRRLLHDYLGFRVFETDLAGGDQQRAIDGLYAELAHTTATHGGFETGVRVYGSRAVDDNMTPHGWFAAEYVTLLRNMLVRERPDGIALMSALSPAWLKPGDAVSVQDAPTTFGKVSFTLRPTDDGARLEWHADVPDGTPIHWPLPDFAKDVQSDNLEKGGRSVLLPSRSGALTVRWKLDGPSLSYPREVRQLRAAYRRRGR
ncbi:MAG TPA: hypothetical protein VE570_13400 [Thermoleophilaceae bacterium]|nr:hypothetical protein [Thermoleophilaceae bacterium]